MKVLLTRTYTKTLELNLESLDDLLDTMEADSKVNWDTVPLEYVDTEYFAGEDSEDGCILTGDLL